MNYFWKIAFSFSIMINCAGGIFSLNQGCTPAQSTEAVQIQQVVLADIEKGVGIVQIELDVTNLLVSANIQKTADEIIVIVNDVIVYILDLGQLPAMYLPQAESMHKQLTLTTCGRAK